MPLPSKASCQCHPSQQFYLKYLIHKTSWTSLMGCGVCLSWYLWWGVLKWPLKIPNQFLHELKHVLVDEVLNMVKGTITAFLPFFTFGGNIKQWMQLLLGSHSCVLRATLLRAVFVLKESKCALQAGKSGLQCVCFVSGDGQSCWELSLITPGVIHF